MAWSPPAIPARLPGWERNYVEAMTRLIERPFGWTAEAHCLAAPAELCVAMTGVDPMHGLRRHKTEAAAWKQLFKLGFGDVEQALEAVFPPVPILLARRGDCGVLHQVVDGRPSPATFIVMGDRAVGRSENGPVYVPVAKLARTFAIGSI